MRLLLEVERTLQSCSFKKAHRQMHETRTVRLHYTWQRRLRPRSGNSAQAGMRTAQMHMKPGTVRLGKRWQNFFLQTARMLMLKTTKGEHHCGLQLKQSIARLKQFSVRMEQKSKGVLDIDT